jgi:hypothetical protein
MKMKAALTAALLFGCVEAWAGGASNVTITRIEAQPQGNFLLYLSSNISSSPACVTLPANANIIVMDGMTAGGKVVISLAQIAYSLGKTVTLSGNNQCDVHAGIETIADIFTTN